jgi:hypothetical protein
MTVARRLLVASGGGAYTAPPWEVRTLTSAPNGGWTQIQDPKAVHYNGKTYIGWIDGTSGATELAAWTHATASLGSVTSIDDLGTPDNHDSPAILVRASDKRLLVFYSRHDGPTMYLRVSTNPEDESTFDARVDLDSQLGSDDYTYPVAYQMTGVPDSPIYLFYRDYVPGTTTGRLAYSKSTDGGTTWATRVLLYTGPSGFVPYWRIASDGDRYLHVFTTDKEPTASKLGHFYFDAWTDKAYTSAGVEITASRPFGFSDITEVHAAVCWSWGATVDSQGRPACVLMYEVSASDNGVKTARWRSGAWQVDTVLTSVGGQLGVNKWASGAGIHHTDPDTVYIARKATKFEMWRYTASDDGASWSGQQLTSGSSADHCWVDVVHSPALGLEAVWLTGTYTSDTNYDFGVSGYG